MKRVWNETLIIEAIKTCKTSCEVHNKFSGGWKWLRRNNRFDLLSHLNKTVEAVTIQEAFGKKDKTPCENSTFSQDCEEAPPVISTT